MPNKSVSELAPGDRIHLMMRFWDVVEVGDTNPFDGRRTLQLKDVKDGSVKEFKIRANAVKMVYDRNTV